MSVCRSYEEKLVLYVYDELDETEQAAVEAHLHACSSCRQQLAGLQKLKTAVPQLSVNEEILQPTRRALFYKLRDMASETSKQPAPWWNVGKLALQTGLAILLVLFGFKLGHQNSITQPSVAMQDLLTAARTISVDGGSISPQFINVDKIKFAPDGTVEISYNTINTVHLQGHGDDPAIQHILQYALLEDDDPVVRQRAVKTVQQLVDADTKLDPTYFDALEQILHEENNLGVTLSVIDILGHAAAQPRAQEMLVGIMLKDENEAIRVQAFKALMKGNQHLSQAENFLTITKLDTNTYIRTKSLELLNKNKGTSL